MHRIAIAAGGTGGHIFPGIALAQELQHQLNTSNIIFIGSKDGIENIIVKKFNYVCLSTHVQKLYRSFTIKNLLFPFFMILSIIETYMIFKKFNISMFIGCGGFVSGIAGCAAKLKKIPILLQEQNSYPGISTRFIAPLAKKIYLGNQKAEDYLTCHKNQVEYTGNPIRPLEKLSQEYAQRILELKPLKTIFFYGGSQGSTAINNVAFSILDRLIKKNIQLIVQTGDRDYTNLNEQIRKKANCIIQPFFENMQVIYSVSDLVICRAGAISLSEVAYFGIPAILIPYPWAAGDHQIKNAAYFSMKKAAVMIEENDLSPDVLFDEIMSILDNNERYVQMKNAMKSLAKPNATKDIVSNIIATLGLVC